MLEYLVILLDDTSVSYCHYERKTTKRNMMDYNVLKDGIMFAMKENLKLQFVFPYYDVPEEYRAIMDETDHCDIKPASNTGGKADVVVIDNWEEFGTCSFMTDAIYVLRTGRKDFFGKCNRVCKVLGSILRLNIIITDVDEFEEEDFGTYEACLRQMAVEVEQLFSEGTEVQLNILTDRMIIDRMNNCDAGYRSITLAPNGKFYVCPAFYIQNPEDDAGSLKEGLKLKNGYLYKPDYAPLCRTCDAYQCRRCVWLNRKTTSEVNIPSHEQCVTAHIERNVSAELLSKIRKYCSIYEKCSINEISYLDPMDVYRKL